MTDWILKMITDYGIVAIFVIVFLEYACLPVPSEIVLPAAGAMAVAFHFKFMYILFLCTLAGLLGSLSCYLIGCFGGKKLIKYFGEKYPKLKRRIDQSIDYYRRYGDFSVAMARIIPLCRTYIAFIAGAFRQRMGHYLFFSLIGIMVWNGTLIGLGYLFSDNIEKISIIIENYKIIIGFAGVILLLYLFFRKKLNEKP